jgi:hypothetical protein
MDCYAVLALLMTFGVPGRDVMAETVRLQEVKLVLQFACDREVEKAVLREAGHDLNGTEAVRDHRAALDAAMGRFLTRATRWEWNRLVAATKRLDLSLHPPPPAAPAPQAPAHKAATSDPFLRNERRKPRQWVSTRKRP